MDVFLQKRPSLFKLTNDHTSTWLDDHNSDLGSATADGGGDSADDGGVFDDDASSVYSVEATRRPYNRARKFLRAIAGQPWCGVQSTN